MDTKWICTSIATVTIRLTATGPPPSNLSTILNLDIRTAELVIGRSINLALSARGRKALAEVGLETKLLEHGIPMYARMIHDRNGNKKIIPYDRKGHQAIYSVGRKYLNEVLLDGNYKIVKS